MMHKIIIDGREDAAELFMYYHLEKATYNPGETVTFSIHTATDTDYRVTSAQAKITCGEYKPGGISTYSFVMPDADVEIDVSSHNSMVNPFINGSIPPNIGMMAMGMMSMMDMKSPVNADAVTNTDSYQWEGKPKFCSECGASTKESNKFCRECGAPLLPMEGSSN